MDVELNPNQRLLLWHLGLQGGKAWQRDVEYKEIARDRKELERGNYLLVGKEGRSITLELKDRGWNELTKAGSVLPDGKKKPSRERAILQLLLDTLHNHATNKSVSMGEILRPARRPLGSSDIQQRIRNTFLEIAGNPPRDSVRLSVLRARLDDVPRQQLDAALLAMKNDRQINLMNLDNPRDIEAEQSSALNDGNSAYHVLWIEP